MQFVVCIKQQQSMQSMDCKQFNIIHTFKKSEFSKFGFLVIKEKNRFFNFNILTKQN